ncbi:ABC-type transport auxiliary lipoprotein family protein [Hydrogenimonas sp.]
MKKSVTALLALWLLGGCALKETPPTHTYALTPPAATPAIKPLENPRFQSLAIALVAPDRVALGRDLFYRRGLTLQPYAYHRWAETPASMLQRLLLLSLRQAHVAESVTTDQSRLRPQARLEITPLDFTQHFEPADGPGRPPRSYGRVVLAATLLDASGRLLGSKTFEASVSAHSPDAEGGVLALDEAAHRVVAEVTAWLAQR